MELGNGRRGVGVGFRVAVQKERLCVRPHGVSHVNPLVAGGNHLPGPPSLPHGKVQTALRPQGVNTHWHANAGTGSLLGTVPWYPNSLRNVQRPGLPLKEK